MAESVRVGCYLRNRLLRIDHTPMAKNTIPIKNSVKSVEPGTGFDLGINTSRPRATPNKIEMSPAANKQILNITILHLKALSTASVYGRGLYISYPPIDAICLLASLTNEDHRY